MLLSGDEMGHTQQGNNNTYCQDNELTWLNWKLDEAALALLSFTRRLIGLRRKHPGLRRHKFDADKIRPHSESPDMIWFRPDGQEMTDEEWSLGWNRSLGLLMSGSDLGQFSEAGEEIKDDNFLLMLNCHHEPIQFYLPAASASGRWQIIIDTANPTQNEPIVVEPNQPVDVRPLSMVVACDPLESSSEKIATGTIAAALASV
jgi:glycogen operon protein